MAANRFALLAMLGTVSEAEMREDVLARYEQVQDIVLRHHHAAAAHVTSEALLEHARHLGVVARGFSDSGAEAPLITDLAVYTAKPGRSRAIDRYARNAALHPGADEALALEAMRQARFSIWRIERRHEIAGVILSDLLRESETWFPDDEFEDEPAGATFAMRLCEPEQFAVACSAPVPVDSAMIEEVAADPLAFRHGDPNAIAEDPRFATAVYRAALAFGAFDAMDAGEAGQEKAAGPAIEDAAASGLVVADALA